MANEFVGLLCVIFVLVCCLGIVLYRDRRTSNSQQGASDSRPADAPGHSGLSTLSHRMRSVLNHSSPVPPTYSRLMLLLRCGPRLPSSRSLPPPRV